MGEEGKKKKLVYEQPRLVNLNGAGGAGQDEQCDTGSGDDVCEAGNSAINDCFAGNTAARFCNIGTAAGSCITGSGIT